MILARHGYSPNLTFKSSLWRRWESGALPFTSLHKWVCPLPPCPRWNVWTVICSSFVNTDWSWSWSWRKGSRRTQLLWVSPATLLTGGEGISQQYSPRTSQQLSHLIPWILTRRTKRSLHPVSFYSLLSASYLLASEEGWKKTQQISWGASPCQKDRASTTMSLLKYEESAREGPRWPPVSSTTWTCALGTTFKSENLTFSWPLRSGWESGDSFSPAAPSRCTI